MSQTIGSAPNGENTSPAGTEKFPISGSQWISLTTIYNYIKNLADSVYSALGHTHTQSQIVDLVHTDTTAIHDNVAGEISALTEKTSPVNGDWVIIEDSENSNNKKKVQAGNLPAASGTDSTAIHDNVSGEINAITEKVTPADADLIIIEDSAASYTKKKVQVSNLPGGAGSGIESGTSFPASPADNDLFFRTDRGILYFYNQANTRWLSVNKYTHHLGSWTNVSAGSTIYSARWDTHEMWIEEFHAVMYAASGLSGTAYWTLTASVLFDNGGAPMGYQLASTNLQSGTNVRFTRKSVTGISYATSYTNDSFQLVLGKTSTPGNFSGSGFLVYRLTEAIAVSSSDSISVSENKNATVGTSLVSKSEATSVSESTSASIDSPSITTSESIGSSESTEISLP